MYVVTRILFKLSLLIFVSRSLDMLTSQKKLTRDLPARNCLTVCVLTKLSRAHLCAHNWELADVPTNLSISQHSCPVTHGPDVVTHSRMTNNKGWLLSTLYQQSTN